MKNYLILGWRLLFFLRRILSELTRRSFLFFLTSLFKSFGLMLLTFFLTPVVLRLLGPEAFGTFRVLTELYGHLSLLELGLYSSLLAALIPACASADSGRLGTYLSHGFYSYALSAILTLAAALSLLPLLPRLTSYGNAPELYSTFLLIAGTSVLIPLQPYRIYLEASNQGHKVNLIAFVQNICFLAAALGFAALGLGLQSQGLALLVSTVIGVVLIVRVAGIRIPWPRHRDPEVMGELRRNQRPQVLNDLAYKIGQNCDQIVIAYFLGPIAVTKVFLGQRIVLILQGQLQALGQSSFASLASLYYTDAPLFRRRVLEVTKILAVASVALLVPVCLLNRAFISLWVGEQFQMDSNALTFLASGNAYLFGLFSFWSLVFTVLGKPAALTPLMWKQALVNVTASVLGAKFIGAEGPVAGTLLSFSLISFWSYPRLLSRHLGIESYEILKRILGPLFVGVITLGIGSQLPLDLAPKDWVTFFLTAGVFFLFYSSSLFYTMFTREERAMNLQRMAKLWDRFRKR